MIVLRDKGGHVFGAFTSQAWCTQANFYGLCPCFPAFPAFLTVLATSQANTSSTCALLLRVVCAFVLLTVGNEEAFLFSAAPTLRLYPVNGHNQNFQYFNLNSHTRPNGLVRAQCVWVWRAARKPSERMHTSHRSGPMALSPTLQGFGGQFEYFGLFLADDLMHGHSKGKPCSTFSSPRSVRHATPTRAFGRALSPPALIWF